MDLVGADLVAADLSHAVLTEADLGGAQLRGANLYGAVLDRAILDRALVTNTFLDEAHLSNARLIEAILDDSTLRRADLTAADLTRASLCRADLGRASLQHAHLRQVNLSGANLHGAKLSDADLSGANLSGANLTNANLDGADLTGASLEGALLVSTSLLQTTLKGCRVFGVSAWQLDLSRVADQTNLRITPDDEPEVAVDNLAVAQFIYLLLRNKAIRDVIDTVTSAVVLILGRFTPERKKVLAALGDELRKWKLCPVIFDFDKPLSKTTAETVSTLAGMARFVIADVTDAKSVLQELERIVPTSPSLPVQPLLLNSQETPGMFDSFEPYPWFLSVFRYSDLPELRASIADVILPAEELARRIRAKRATPKGGDEEQR